MLFLKRKRNKSRGKIIFALVTDSAILIFRDGESSLRVDFSKGREAVALESAENRIQMLCTGCAWERPVCDTTLQESERLGLSGLQSGALENSLWGEKKMLRTSTFTKYHSFYMFKMNITYV